MRQFPLILLVLTLAGCAKPLEVGSITEIKPPPGAQGLDLYAARRAAGDKVPDFAGDQIVEVRTYAATESGSWGDEFAGAACTLKARDYSVSLTTPAKVRVPVFRAQSSPLAAECQKEGFAPTVSEVGVYDLTKEQRLNSAAGAGAMGILFMAAVNAASDETTHDFAYPLVRVVMTPLATAKTANATTAAQR